VEPPQDPAGPFQSEETYDDRHRAELIATIEQAPDRLRRAVAGLAASQLDTRYRNWTIRQIVHHVPHSHLNSYMRFKWALTEERPTIKAYDEARWVTLADARTGDVGPPLALLEGLHQQWVQLMRVMSPEQWSRTFVHPETGKALSLTWALGYYAWHGKHHTAQVMWVMQRHGWS
jgi:hypothetical protein